MKCLKCNVDMSCVAAEEGVDAFAVVNFKCPLCGANAVTVREEDGKLIYSEWRIMPWDALVN